jgi:hypothetical protein
MRNGAPSAWNGEPRRTRRISLGRETEHLSGLHTPEAWNEAPGATNQPTYSTTEDAGIVLPPRTYVPICVAVSISCRD